MVSVKIWEQVQKGHALSRVQLTWTSVVGDVGTCKRKTGGVLVMGHIRRSGPLYLLQGLIAQSELRQLLDTVYEDRLAGRRRQRIMALVLLR